LQKTQIHLLCKRVYKKENCLPLYLESIMSQLIQLKRRIESIKKTSKITHAMRLMAMSIYSTLERKNISIGRYRERISKLFTHSLQYNKGWKHPIFYPEDILDATPLFIIVASTKGLCGSFNSNLKRYFERTFIVEDHQNPTFITIGDKAKSFLLTGQQRYIAKHFQSFASSEIVSIAETITAHILSHRPIHSSVTVYCNTFKNFFTQIPSRSSIIPFHMHGKNPKKNKELSKVSSLHKYIEEEEPIWEQDKDRIMLFICERNLKALLFDILIESLLSEHAARFVAMDLSTSNAEKYLEKLTLKFNKSRQALITREVAELSAGFGFK